MSYQIRSQDLFSEIKTIARRCEARLETTGAQLCHSIIDRVESQLALQPALTTAIFDFSKRSRGRTEAETIQKMMIVINLHRIRYQNPPAKII